jgi:hypothetical protein
MEAYVSSPWVEIVRWNVQHQGDLIPGWFRLAELTKEADAALIALAPDLARLVLEAEEMILEAHGDAAREWTASLAALNERLEK